MTITLTKTKAAIAVVVVALLVPATAFAANSFTDVPAEKFYAGPVDWAFNNDITTGKTATSFAPEDNVTRGE
ncbi:MAG: S-layer homology domain-containing protein, partial [Acidimicrobiales bacterium]